MAKTVILSIFTEKDLKTKPYSERLANILVETAKWLGATAYEGDVYLGPTPPVYKIRNRKFKLPKNYEIFKSEIAEGNLWNMCFFDVNKEGGNAVFAVLQPDRILKKPANIIFEIMEERARSDMQTLLQFWTNSFIAVDLAGWGFADITDNPSDYFYKLSGITYTHFSSDWKKEIEIWNKNGYRCREGILDVYWKNLWSPDHVRRLGGIDIIVEQLGNDFEHQILSDGGMIINIPVNINEIGSSEYEAKRRKLREIAKAIIF